MDNSPDKIRLLVAASVWPHIHHAFEAANVITFSIVSELARSGLYDITFLYINTSLTSIPEQAESDMAALRQAGVHFLEPLLITPQASLLKRPFTILKALFYDPAAILLGYGKTNQLKALLQRHNIDAVLSIWSEIGLNILANFPATRFAYHGNPDHKVFDAQYEILRLCKAEPHGVKGLAHNIKHAVLSRMLERAHLSVLHRYTLVANVAANDAAYYTQKGVHACYLQNMWPTPILQGWEEQRDQLEMKNPGKIIGSVGNMSATGNSLGFIALEQEVLPALKRRLPQASFEIHIFGAKEPKPPIKRLLNDPHIKLRGFVDGLDAEIMSAPVFLISNNHHRFKVGHTRFLHAWSMGACVVAFADCREAMPEIEHGKNALLGHTAEEVADLVAQALSDRELRRRIGRGGIETLRSRFDPINVTHTLSHYMLDRCHS